ncbi:hypothetical protein GCM10007913_11830 [Devosia yakushimensis]|uniref:Phage tail collar domain-containing protein n=1 Tax=Devosia yakushimensis TaxID=470028 RepID=A0ABQ5UFA2_9HYPH|nr:tail fiber protein [Devosia yakushimensis]GLQ09251.1 hypothetical protein GCM10007913_11830 [Devosia yakushimensis]
MPQLLLSNNATSTLAANLSNVATTLAVQSGHAALFPALGADQWFPVTVVDAAGNLEIMRCTGRSGSTLTVVRGQEGTAAKAFNAGARVDLRLTAAAFGTRLDDYALAAPTAKATLVDNDQFPLLDSEAGNERKKTLWSTVKAGVWGALGALINAGVAKAAPVDADAIALMDSADANKTKKLTWLALKAGVWAAFGALIASGTAKTTLVDSDAFAVMDSADANKTKSVNWAYVRGALEPAIGQVIEFTGDALPPKCIWPAGQNISRTTYAAYFAAVGTKYGAGNGSTTFGVPDYRGRARAGRDDMGGTPANRLTAAGGIAGTTLGAVGGAETVALTTNQMPAHQHAGSTSGYSHAHSGSTSVDGNHQHGMTLNNQTSSGAWPRATNQGGTAGFLTDFAGSHAHTFGTSTDTHSHSFTTDTRGSGAAHPNLQPTMIMNFAIFVGV